MADTKPDEKKAQADDAGADDTIDAKLKDTRTAAQAAGTLDAFNNLSNDEKINQMFCMPTYTNRGYMKDESKEKFINKHAECHKAFLVSGKKLCVIYTHHDGHPEGFDPAEYGIKWKKSFARAFEKARQPFTDLEKNNWYDLFVEYLKETNKGDQVLERECIVADNDTDSEGEIKTPLSDKKKSSMKKPIDKQFDSAKIAVDKHFKKMPGWYNQSKNTLGLPPNLGTGVGRGRRLDIPDKPNPFHAPHGTPHYKTFAKGGLSSLSGMNQASTSRAYSWTTKSVDGVGVHRDGPMNDDRSTDVDSDSEESENFDLSDNIREKPKKTKRKDRND